MNDKLAFRIFREGDRDEFEQMALSLYAEDPSTEGMSPEKILRTFNELLHHPEKGTIVLFEMGKDIVGYSILIHFWSNEYGGNIEVIDELFVKPESRGRGVASRFIGHLCTENHDSVKGLHLEVTPRNERAKALYLRHGFRSAKNEHLFKRL